MTIETAFLRELQRVLAAQGRGFQTEIARKLEIKPSTFSNMVNGRRGLPEELRPKIAELAGIDYEALLQREGIIGRTVPISDVPTTVRVAGNGNAAGNISGSKKSQIISGHGGSDQVGHHHVAMDENEWFLWQVYKRIPATKRQEVLEACQLPQPDHGHLPAHQRRPASRHGRPLWYSRTRVGQKNRNRTGRLAA